MKVTFEITYWYTDIYKTSKDDGDWVCKQTEAITKAFDWQNYKLNVAYYNFSNKDIPKRNFDYNAELSFNSINNNKGSYTITFSQDAIINKGGGIAWRHAAIKSKIALKKVTIIK